MIVALYMPLLDTIMAASGQTGTLSIHRGLWFQLLILLIGLAIALVEVRKSANQNSQKTKILNIVDEEPSQTREEPRRVVKNLFDEEDLD